MKKGFTLIEVTSVIVILGVIALITFPIIDKSIKESKQKALEQTINNIERAAFNYSVENDLGTDTNYKSITLSELQESGYLNKNDIINSVTDEAMSGCVVYRWDSSYNQYEFEYSEECEIPEISVPKYVDNSGANTPDLLDNMIPIHYIDANEDGTYEWVYADIYEEWYDYDKQEWANAVVLNADANNYEIGDSISMDDIALMYVWIPRYTYTIFNGNDESVEEQVINIQFERGIASSGTVSCIDVDFTTNPTSESSETCTDKNGSIENGTSTYTHPAFTFGSDELTGFWVGKFEVSGSTDVITIKPNVDSLRTQTVSSFFTSIQNIKTTYGLNGDSHMMKNMEWGAVAYLKQSQYGLGITDIGINNYDNSGVYMTGCGALAGSTSSITCTEYNAGGEIASTTGNVYGVYDMSGGAWEYVMGNMVNENGEFYSSSAEFTTIDSKYYDAYAYNGSSSKTHSRGKLGDATKETLATFGSTSGGWTSDMASFPRSSDAWFFRGGIVFDDEFAGVFNFYYSSGTADGSASTRAVLNR